MDFDKIVERKNTDCLKYDAATRRGYPADILPLWVADMDFPTAFPVLKALRRRFKHEINGAGYSQLNTLGLAACEAAYRDGRPWLEELKSYLQGNIAFTQDFLKRNLPQVKLAEPEGTYLLWLDFRGLGLTGASLDRLIVDQAGLWLDSGAIFGHAGEGFQRINIACPRAVLAEALERIARAVYR